MHRKRAAFIAGGLLSGGLILFASRLSVGGWFLLGHNEAQYTKLPNNTRHPISREWAPVAVSECLDNMPKHMAPCLAISSVKDVISAHELFYPDFAIRQPIFPNEQHREKWLKMAAGIPERASIVKDWLVYRGQHGQNFVLSNRSYTSDPPLDSWSPIACMADDVHLEGLQTGLESDDPLKSYKEFDQVIFAGAPDSYSFQHFENRVTHILLQAEAFSPNIDSNPFAVTGRKGSETVEQLWQAMGFDTAHVLHSPGPIAARQFVFSCRVPLIHPWFAMRTLEQLGIQSQWAHPNPSMKKKIVYVSRNHGSTRNGGRKVVNEDNLVAALQTYLQERNDDHELIMFDQGKFANITELMHFFVNEVGAIIGSHGGGLMNHRMASRGTLIIEFMSTAWPDLSNYEESGLMSQPYATIMADPAPNTQTDMLINATEVVDILSTHLDRTEERQTLRHHYQWTAEELHLNG